MNTNQKQKLRDKRYRWGTEGRCTRCGRDLLGEVRATCVECCKKINALRDERRRKAREAKQPPAIVAPVRAKRVKPKTVKKPLKKTLKRKVK